MKLHVIPALCFATLLTPALAADGQPYLNAGTILYGRAGGYSEAVCADIAKHFDIAIGLQTQPNCRSVIKAAYPQFKILLYVNSNNCTSGDPLCSYIEAQARPEDFFLNLTAESVQQVAGKSFRRPAGSRVCSYGTGYCDDGGPGRRWQTDYMSATTRAFLADYFKNLQLDPQMDGLFFDNSGPGGSNGGDLLSGSADNGIRPPFKFSIEQPMESHHNALKAALEASLPKSWTYFDNTGTYGLSWCGPNSVWKECATNVAGTPLSYPVARAAVVTRGILQEFFYRFVRTYPDIDGNYQSLREIWYAKGQPENHAYFLYWQPTGNGSDVADGTDRVRMFGLATHLLYQWPTAYYHYHSASNTTPETDWYPAMSAPFGKPLASKTALGTHAFERRFENSIVIVRFRMNAAENYTDTGTYSLGGTYYPVRVDGTYAPPVTEVVLRNSEGFIGIKDRGALPPAAPKNLKLGP